MALTDNRTHLQDCENSAEISGDTDSSPTATTSESGFVIEGTNAVSLQITNATEHILFDQDLGGSTFNLDLSDSTVYIMVKDNLTQPFQSLGGMVCLNDGADGAGGDDIGYEVAGNDVVGLPYAKRYHAFKLDVNQAAANPGTSGSDHFVFNGTEAGLNQAAILQVGYGANHLAKAVGTVPNAWMDGIYYIANDSYAASITGGTSGTPETMTDLVGDDEAVGAGMFANPIGTTYYIFAPTEFGDSGTGTSAFAGTDETWLYLGDNGGGRPVGATHFPMRLVGNATGTNIFRQTRVINQNVGTRAQFDMSDTNVDEVTLDTTTWIDFGALTMPTVDASKNIDSSTFINCDQMDLQSCNMDGNTWIGTTDADGAIIWDENTSDVQNQTNSTFISDGTGNAIEIAPTGAGPFTYTIDGLIVDGYDGQSGTAADMVFFINPSTLSADININLSNSSALNVGVGGAGFSYREVASYTGTVTITQTVTLTVTVLDTANQAIEGVRVRIENQSTGALITQGSTNASGIYTDASYNYTGDLAVTIKARLKGYKNFRTAGTITGDGISVGVTLQDDNIVDLP
jgi:hypothetical protein